MLHDIVVLGLIIGLVVMYAVALWVLISSVIELFKKDRKDDNK